MLGADVQTTKSFLEIKLPNYNFPLHNTRYCIASRVILWTLDSMHAVKHKMLVGETSTDLVVDFVLYFLLLQNEMTQMSNYKNSFLRAHC